MAPKDRVNIIYGHMACTDFSFGFLSFDGKTWTLDEEAAKEHFCKIANSGANAVRILPYAVWEARPYGRKSQFCPWVLDSATNTWNLSKFNSYYFPIMRRLFEIINSYNMTVWFPWFDQCQMYAPGSSYSPWKHNTQGVSSFLDAAADPYTKSWIKKVVAEFAGLDVLWPWGNEVENPQYVPMAKRVIFPLIKSLKLDFNRMTYGAMMQECPYLGNGEYGDKLDNQGLLKAAIGDEFGDPAKLDMYREVHAVGRPLDPPDKDRPFGTQFAQAMYFWGKNPIRKVLSDDGVHECVNPIDGGRPTPAIWKAMATAALTYPVALGGRDKLISFEHLPEGGDLDYQVSVIKAISEAYKARFGAWPEN